MPAVGSLTTTLAHIKTNNQPTRSYRFAWTSDASTGAVSGITTATATTPVGKISGTIVGVKFIPGSGGTQPTSLYDVVLNDEDAIDVLAGLGANLSNSAASVKCPGVTMSDGTVSGMGLRFLDNEQLELQVSNAGNSKTGAVVLYVR